jgi:eukaryotic-like serine/threonine-protein kinase
MTPQQRHDRVLAVFDEARSLPLSERESFLQRICGDDDDSRCLIESLLAHDSAPISIISDIERGGGLRLLLDPTLGSTRPLAGHEAPIPENFPGYVILEPIAQGGMGAVFKAEQAQPRRIVALKVLHAGATSEAMARRLRREAQLLGRLQHPGIATIFDAGALESTFNGLTRRTPYFAMEFIEGRTLDRFAREENLKPRAIVALITRICEALQYAHERGVIHRDLKPGNILVAGSGPKILDFGVARLVEGDEGQSLETQAGQLVGTLAYMSPEQADGDALSLDVRCDVYALGVILYELLAGRRPHDLSNLRVMDAVRTLQSVEPRRLGDIDRRLRGDLDVIVHKALEKSPASRYQTVRELSDDLRRYLAFEPLAARPASVVDRTLRFARRNRLLVAASLTVAAALVGGTIASTVFALQARAADQQSRRSGARAKAVNNFLVQDLLSAADANRGATVDLKLVDAIRSAIPRIDRAFAAEPETALDLHRLTAELLRGLGDFDSARQEAGKAFDLSTSLHGADAVPTLAVRALQAQIECDAGRNVPAEAIAREVLNKLNPGAEDARETRWKVEQVIADVKYALRDAAAAEQLYRTLYDELRAARGEHDPSAIVVLGKIAGAKYSQHQYEEVAALQRQVLDESMRSLGPDHRRTSDAQHDLATVLYKLNCFDEAEPLFQACLESRARLLGPRHPDYADTLYQYARLKVGQGDLPAALALGQEALPLQRAAYGSDHEFVPRTLNLIAHILKEQQRFAEAEPYYRESHELYRRTQGPQSKAYAISTLNIGTNLLYQERYADALPYITDGVTLGDAAYPEQSDFRVRSRLALARCHARLGQAQLAREQYGAVLELSDGQATSETIQAMRGEAQLELTTLSRE